MNEVDKVDEAQNSNVASQNQNSANMRLDMEVDKVDEAQNSNVASQNQNSADMRLDMEVDEVDETQNSNPHQIKLIMNEVKSNKKLIGNQSDYDVPHEESFFNKLPDLIKTQFPDTGKNSTFYMSRDLKSFTNIIEIMKKTMKVNLDSHDVSKLFLLLFIHTYIF